MRIGRGQKPLERPEEPRPALIEEEHPVGEPLGKAHIVRHHDAGKPKLALEALDEVSQAAGDDWIHHGGWLVVEHHLGLRGQCAGNGHRTLAPGGEAGGNASATSSAPTRPIKLSTISCIWSSARPPRSRNGKATFSRTLSESKRAPFWKTMVTRLRMACMPSLSSRPVISWPSTLDGPGIRLEKAHQQAQSHRFAHAAAAQNAERLAAVHVRSSRPPEPAGHRRRCLTWLKAMIGSEASAASGSGSFSSSASTPPSASDNSGLDAESKVSMNSDYAMGYGAIVLRAFLLQDQVVIPSIETFAEASSSPGSGVRSGALRRISRNPLAPRLAISA
jgi:hypothetical protein